MKVFLIPPPTLPVPAVQGGAVETLLTHLIEQNEEHAALELVIVSIPDEAAALGAAAYRHTRIEYLPRPGVPTRLACAARRAMGEPSPTDPWYYAVEQLVRREQPDVVIGEGGELTQLRGISAAVGRSRCLAHLHGHTLGSTAMDEIYGGVLAISEFVREAYLKSSLLPDRTAYLLRNCIPVEHFSENCDRDADLEKSLGFTAQDFIVLFCGRLAEDKGIHKLLEALALSDDSHLKLLVVGGAFFGLQDEDEFTENLRAQAAALGDRVVFTGYIDAEDLPRYYGLADLVCIPTLVEEAAGLVAIEAMACRRPVLATDSGGMPEYLADSEAMLVPRGEDLALRLSRGILQLQADPSRRAHMGAAAAQQAKKFTTEQYYQEFIRIMKDFGGCL